MGIALENEVSDGDGKGRFFDVVNGYVCSDTPRLESLTEKLEALGEDGRDQLRAALHVGFVRGAEVVFQAVVPFSGLVPLAASMRQQQDQQVKQSRKFRRYSALQPRLTHCRPH